GRVGPWFPPGWPGFEVGWGIASEFRGKGYAVEAARAAIDWSFATFEIDRIVHCIDHENAASRAVARRLTADKHGETDLFGSTAPVSIWHAPLVAISTGNIVVFWLFTRALFDDAFKMRLWHVLIWAAVAGFSFVNCAWIAPASAGNARFSIVAINLLALGFI